MNNLRLSLALCCGLALVVPDTAFSECSLDGVPPGTAQFVGTIADDTGAPVPDAQVRISIKSPGIMCAAHTGPDGRFAVREIPGGRYTLLVGKYGYPTVSGRFVDIARGQTLELPLTLPRGASITGRITDETGQPVVRAGVQAMRLQHVRSGELFPFAASVVVTTDESGTFKLSELAAGSYILAAVPPDPHVTYPATARNVLRGDGLLVPVFPTLPVGITRTYFPGTGVLSDAEPVTTKPGEVLSDLVFSLSKSRPAPPAIAIDSLLLNNQPRAKLYGVLSGTVRNIDGTLAADSVVIVVERQAGGTPANQRFVRIARGDQSGRFWIRTLWPSAQYRALALSSLEAGQEFNPSLQERVLSEGQPLSILEGQTATIGLLLSGP